MSQGLPCCVRLILPFLPLEQCWRLRLLSVELSTRILNTVSMMGLKAFAEETLVKSPVSVVDHVCDLHFLSRSRTRQMLWLYILLKEVESLAEYRPGSPSTSWKQAIKRDLSRTMPDDIRIGSQEGQGALFRVLNALAGRLGEIGYCQGMNFLVAVILRVFWTDNMQEFVSGRERLGGGVPLACEARVFRCALAMLLRFKLVELYLPSLPQLGRLTWQFDHLVSAYLPRLDGKLREVGQEHLCALSSQFYGSQWFLTLFAYDLPPSVSVLVWDRFLLYGWKFMMKVGLCVLYQMQDGEHGALAQPSSDHVVQFMKSVARSRDINWEAVLFADQGKFKVTNRMLAELDRLYPGNPRAQRASPPGRSATPGSSSGSPSSGRELASHHLASSSDVRLVLVKDLHSGKLEWRVSAEGRGEGAVMHAGQGTESKEESERNRWPESFFLIRQLTGAALRFIGQETERSNDISSSPQHSSPGEVGRRSFPMGLGTRIEPFLIRNLDTDSTGVMGDAIELMKSTSSKD